jgi:AcrR family transcriptional regulator
VELAPDDLARMTRMPPGRHHIPRDIVERHQRGRIEAAMVRLVNEQGYPAVSLTQIVKAAGVARQTFYEHFRDKEALFLAIFDEAVQSTLSRVTEAAEAQTGPWEEKMRAGAVAFLERVAAEPELARLCLIESQSAGPVALARYEDMIQRFASLLRTGRRRIPRESEPPAAMEEIVVGGVIWMVTKRLELRDVENPDEILPGVLEFVLTPYLGKPAAKLAARQAD